LRQCRFRGRSLSARRASRFCCCTFWYSIAFCIGRVPGSNRQGSRCLSPSHSGTLTDESVSAGTCRQESPVFTTPGWVLRIRGTVIRARRAPAWVGGPRRVQRPSEVDVRAERSREEPATTAPPLCAANRVVGTVSIPVSPRCVDSIVLCISCNGGFGIKVLQGT